MKTLRITLVTLLAVAAASASLAGPRGKTTPRPSGSAYYRVSETSAPAASSEKRMFEKSGKRTSSTPCDNETAKCKAHCGS
jgi:hypothetical protein